MTATLPRRTRTRQRLPSSRRRACPGLPRLRRRSSRSPPSTPVTSVSARSRSPTTTRRSPRVTRAADRGRPAQHLAVRGAAAHRPGPGHPGHPQPRLHAADPRRPRSPPRSASRAPLWVKDDSANPTHSFKDRVVSVALTAAQALGFTGSPAPPPATWPTRWPRTRPGPAYRRWSSSRPTWSRARSSPPRSTAATWSPSTAPTTTSTGCARS